MVGKMIDVRCSVHTSLCIIGSSIHAKMVIVELVFFFVLPGLPNGNTRGQLKRTLNYTKTDIFEKKELKEELHIYARIL